MSSVQISGAYGIAASVTTVRDPDTWIQYVLHVTNVSDSDEQLSYGACWGGLRFYKTPARTGTAIFDTDEAEVGEGCIGVWNQTTIQTGTSTDLTGEYREAGVLSAGVPPGHYYVSVVVTTNGETTEIAAGEVDIQQ
jgi:hypothetical protein